jgi:hypothetical protein
MKNIDEIKNEIENAANIILNNVDSLNSDMKDLRSEFIEYMTNSFNKKETKKLKGKLKRHFNLINRYMYDNVDDTKKDKDKKLYKLAANVAVIFKYLDFINNPIFENYLEAEGIFIDKDKSIKLKNEFNLNIEANENLADIINDGVNVKEKCEKELHSEIKNIYDDNIGSDSEIKFSTFSKIAMGKYLSIKDKEKFNDFKQKTIENSLIKCEQEALIQSGLSSI